MEWPLNWEPVIPEAKQAFEAELRRAAMPGHPLYAVPVKAVARRNDCDNVLFTVVGTPAVAVVHLSYSPPTDSTWPHTQVFGSLSEWAEQAAEIEYL